MEMLREKGSVVNYSDPYIETFPTMRDHIFNLSSVDITNPKVLKDYDLVIISTNHSSFDYEAIKLHSQLLVDTRGVYTDYDKKIIKA